MGKSNYGSTAQERAENRRYWKQVAKQELRKNRLDLVFSAWQSYVRNGGSLKYGDFKARVRSLK